MREAQYKVFSLDTHRKNSQRNLPNVCQFELTFKCDLHCQHCYADCYNKPEVTNFELTTKEIKFILDKVYNAGVIWLCFTGGDPLTRKDFLEIYSYAREKGFIITIFTNGYSMTQKIARFLKKTPPFVIEITLNAVTKDLYESISGRNNSFNRAMGGINIVLKEKLPLKIKTLVTKNNLTELPKIKKSVKSLGLKLDYDIFVQARLDGDLTPCNLRISPREAVALGGLNPKIDECQFLTKSTQRKAQNRLFPCTILGTDGIHIDPFGNMFPCSCIREPKINILKEDILESQADILNLLKTWKFHDGADCKFCSKKNSCAICPGKALLERGNLGEKVDWFCELAHII